MPSHCLQGIGIAKAVVSLSLFHEGRMFLAAQTKAYNVRNNYLPKPKAAATPAPAKAEA